MVVVPLVEPTPGDTNVTVTAHDAPAATVAPTLHGVAPLPTAVKPSPPVVKLVIV